LGRRHGFLLPLKIHYLGWVLTREHWFNGKHANHHTTDVANVVGSALLSEDSLE
jgi:hypothetical protein